MRTIQEELARVFATRELNRIDQLRACAAAKDQGLTQSEIAHRLAISQPEVHRILRKVASFPELLERTPREVILDFHADKISHESMLDELKTWNYTFAADAQPDNPEGALTQGSWDDIVDAVHRDLIDVQDYEELAHTAHPRAA